MEIGREWMDVLLCGLNWFGWMDGWVGGFGWVAMGWIILSGKGWEGWDGFNGWDIMDGFNGCSFVVMDGWGRYLSLVWMD